MYSHLGPQKQMLFALRSIIVVGLLILTSAQLFIDYPEGNTKRQLETLVNTPDNVIGVSPTVVFSVGTEIASQISASKAFTCAIMGNGSMMCWGQNDNGRLGDGTTSDSNNPVSVLLPMGMTAINLATGDTHTCAILNDSSLSCWGKNNRGQLGDGTKMPHSVPASVSLPNGRTAISIAAGSKHTCAVLDDGSVSCWGDNGGGQLGIGSANNRDIPTSVSLPLSRTAVSISTGEQHSCSILDNGSVACWGNNGNGQLGDDNTNDQNSPVFLIKPNSQNVTSISLGKDHSCGLWENGSIYCWGDNSEGQLGDGTFVGKTLPTLVRLPTGRIATSINSGSMHTCATLDDGSMLCWGDNGNGQLGDGSTSSSSTPTSVAIPNGRYASKIGAGQDYSCAIVNDGTTLCWGKNDGGQLGDGSNSNRITLTESVGFNYSILSESVEQLQLMANIRILQLEGNLSEYNVSFSTPPGLIANLSAMTIKGVLGWAPSPIYSVTFSKANYSINTTYTFNVLRDTDGDTVPNIDDFDDDGDGIFDDDDGCSLQAGNSTIDSVGCPDTDGDGWSNIADQFPADSSQWSDSDGDGYGDNISGTRPDNCPSLFGDSNMDRYGCIDSDNDGFSDSDSVWKESDGADAFPLTSSQWADVDGDGYGDNLLGYKGDACPSIVGLSWQDQFGCLDTDGDGWSNEKDEFIDNPTQYSDSDGDGYGDNNTPGSIFSDAFPVDGTQWNDTDNDGHGDNAFGFEGDWFPNDPLRWADSDRDGAADEDDSFINDITQWNDTDGDGFGDNELGTRGDSCPQIFGNSSVDRFGCIDTDGDGLSDLNDAFPNDASKWKDVDGDGHADEDDAFPFNPSQWADIDGDGFGDNALGIGADRFPNDSSQWSDIDGDGFGDNSSGNNSDAFPTDPTQHADRDGDGYGDSLSGRLADMFPDDPTQWEDNDGDGLGDNQSGNNPDPYLNDFDNDGYNDSIDPLPKLSSPGDLDNDGCADEIDMFVDDYRECRDSDNDGVGDHADNDDDNDGWSDADEMRAGTDPFDASSQPVDSFEIVVPGTSIGLGAWDLIGMFGGIPVFLWLGFGFATRNRRAIRYEKQLNESKSRHELEQIAIKWEYSLMLRLLGPHQGIRLERLRAELDDKLEYAEHKLAEGDDDIDMDKDIVSDIDQTDLVDITLIDTASEKDLPFLDEETEAGKTGKTAAGHSGKTGKTVAGSSKTNKTAGVAKTAAGSSSAKTNNEGKDTPPPSDSIGEVSDDGYEYLEYESQHWYREAESTDPWELWLE